MTASSLPAVPVRDPPRRTVMLAGLALILAVLAAYADSLSGPFVFDDIPAIVDNPTLRTWWSLDRVLVPPKDATVSGRPLLNLSLALNYACGGTAVTGYHLVNVGLHAAATLTLFGIVRRAWLLAKPGQKPTASRASADATLVAFTAAALWALHPLQAEAVTYVVQRAESMMGLFFLLTLYCFKRGTLSPAPWRWFTLSVTACACGMATKENMVAAPLLVLLFDRALVAGSFREAWRRHGRFYLASGATWILLGALVASTGGNRGGSVGWGTTASATAYWLTQFPAITRYLALSIWPDPLVFDYGAFWIAHPIDVLPHALLVGTLAVATLVALWRHALLGFLGGWFFAVLAPTSLLPGTTQMIVEHRVYLPLAAVVVLITGGVFRLSGRRGLIALGGVALILGTLTFHRNQTYRDDLALWSDTVAKRPKNAQAHFHLAGAYLQRGRDMEAMSQYEQATALAPDYGAAHNNLGNLLRRLGRPGEALPHYEEALRLAPNVAETHNNIANALAQMGRAAEAMAHYNRAIQLNPSYPEAQANLAGALVGLGQPQAALPHFERALALRPDFIDARAGYGGALAESGQIAEALAQFEGVLRDQPARTEIRYNYASVLHAAGRISEAIAQFEAVLRTQPDFAPAREAFTQLRAEAVGIHH